MTLEEVDQDESKGFKVVSPTLLNSQVGIYRGIPGSSSEILSVPVGNMLSSFWVSEPLGESKINYVDEVLLFSDSNKEVIGLDIPVEEMP